MSLNLNEPKSVSVDDYGVEASKGLRFANFLIDIILITVLTFFLGIGIGIILVVASGPNVDLNNPVLNILSNLIGAVALVGYYILFEYLFQRTPGKLVTGTIVVSNSGERPSFGQILGRSFSRLIPFEAIIGLFTDFPHDSLPGTKVVMKS